MIPINYIMGRKRLASVLISKMHRGSRHFAFQNTRILVEAKLCITMRAPNTLKKQTGPVFYDLPSPPPRQKRNLLLQTLVEFRQIWSHPKKNNSPDLDMFVMLGQVLSTVFPKLVAINAKSFLGWSPLVLHHQYIFFKRAAAVWSSFLLLLLLLPSPPPLLLNKKQG